MTPPQKEKLTVSWDEVNSPQVDARLKEQDAKAREDAFTSPAATLDHHALKKQQRASIWYNTVFAMSFFGVVGGLLAWGAGALIQLNPVSRAQYVERLRDAHDKVLGLTSAAGQHYVAMERARDDPDARRSEERRYALKVGAIEEAAAGNPYFDILRRPDLSPRQKEQLVADQHAAYDMKLLIAKVVSYGLIGMLIALSLAVAEPVLDRHAHTALVSGAVGATLGLIGGVVVSLFVDRLHAALGGSDDASLTSAQQLLADATKYGVIGLFLTIAPGVVMRNAKKLGVGLAGGLLGGLAGGALVGPVAKLAGSEMLARAVAFVAIGGVAGLATGLIENAAKTGWLKVVQGLIAGKQFILYRATTYIGSAPDCHIYLFKDPRVGRRHAAVHVVNGGFDLEDLPLGTPTLINGRPATRQRLRTGDQVQIGSTVFTFQEKVKK